MDITLPSTFPATDFRAFCKAATIFLPALLSDEALSDPNERRTHFDWSWQAVRYRYRSCAECSDEFKALLDNPSEMWEAGWGDEELTYKLERCIYVFFMSAVSVFDSFALCLYFLGNALQPSAFPDVAKPEKISRSSTHKAMSTAFPNDAITGLLGSLRQDPRFARIGVVRNLLAHRISGRRCVGSHHTRHRDGRHTTDWHEETWHIPGVSGKLIFDKDMLQRHFDDVTTLLSSFVVAARQFAEAHAATKGQP